MMVELVCNILRIECRILRVSHYHGGHIINADGYKMEKREALWIHPMTEHESKSRIDEELECKLRRG